MSLSFFFQSLYQDVTPFLTTDAVPLVLHATYQIDTEGLPLAGTDTQGKLLVKEQAVYKPEVPYWPNEWLVEVPEVPPGSKDIIWPSVGTSNPLKIKFTLDEQIDIVELLPEPGWPQPTQVGGYSLWRPDEPDQGPWPEIQRFLFVPQCDPVIGCVSGDLYIIVERKGVAYPPMISLPKFTRPFVSTNDLQPWYPPDKPNWDMGSIWRFGWVSEGMHVLPTPSHQFRIKKEAWKPDEFVQMRAPSDGVIFRVQYGVNWRELVFRSGVERRKFFDFVIHYAVGQSYYLVVTHVHQPVDSILEALGDELPPLESLDVGSFGSVLVNVPLLAGARLGYFGGGALIEEVMPPQEEPQMPPLVSTAIELAGVDYAKNTDLMGKSDYVAEYEFGDSPLQWFSTSLQQDYAKVLLANTAAPVFGMPGPEYWGRHDWDNKATLSGNWLGAGVAPLIPSNGQNLLALVPHFADAEYGLVSIGNPEHWVAGAASGLYVVSDQATPFGFESIQAAAYQVDLDNLQEGNPIAFEVASFDLAPAVSFQGLIPVGFLLVGFQYNNPNQILIQTFVKTVNQPFAPTQFQNPAVNDWCSKIAVYIRAGT